MFYVGEFLHAFTVSALTATLFLGGWRGPWAEQWPILGVAYFFVKTFIVYFFVILLRITMPRLRIDQMLNFNWKFLTPIALVLLIGTALVEKVLQMLGQDALLIRTAAHLGMNFLIVWGTVEILRRSAKKERQRVAEPRPVAIAPQNELLMTHPRVLEVCTIGVPDAYRGENVKTYIVVKPGQTLTEEEVKAFCRDSLAAYKVPKLVAFIDALPKSAVGKILRRELRDLDAKMQAGKSWKGASPNTGRRRRRAWLAGYERAASNRREIIRRKRRFIENHGSRREP